MIRFILLLTLQLLAGITSQAQQWYYIPSGNSPEANLPWYTSIYVVIKDNSGQLWYYRTDLTALKYNLGKNINFYVNAFNNGTHMGPGSKIEFRNDPYLGLQSITPDEYYEDEIFFKGNVCHSFHKVNIKEKNTKCFVTTAKDMGYCAFSYDFKTLIVDYKNAPKYYTSIPVDRFIIPERNADDLF